MRIRKKLAVSRLSSTWLKSPDRVSATRSLRFMREAISPAERWVKNSAGRRSACQKKRLADCSAERAWVRLR